MITCDSASSCWSSVWGVALMKCWRRRAGREPMGHSLSIQHEGYPSKKRSGFSFIPTNRDQVMWCTSVPNGETSPAIVCTPSSVTVMRYVSGLLRQNSIYSSCSPYTTEQWGHQEDHDAPARKS